jgi:hypothetical protein
MEKPKRVYGGEIKGGCDGRRFLDGTWEVDLSGKDRSSGTLIGREGLDETNVFQLRGKGCLTSTPTGSNV